MAEGIVPPSVGRNNQIQKKQPALNPSASARPRKLKHLISAT